MKQCNSCGVIYFLDHDKCTVLSLKPTTEYPDVLITSHEDCPSCDENLVTPKTMVIDFDVTDDLDVQIESAKQWLSRAKNHYDKHGRVYDE